MKHWDTLTQAQRIERWENVLRVLRALTPHERREHWSMGTFGYADKCGTVACAAGHCGMDAWFRRRNFRMDIRADGGSDISDVYDFFGQDGAHEIFMNLDPRPVGTVINEVRAYIKQLKVSQ
jgi:hypothetical protein